MFPRETDTFQSWLQFWNEMNECRLWDNKSDACVVKWWVVLTVAWLNFFFFWFLSVIWRFCSLEFLSLQIQVHFFLGLNLINIFTGFFFLFFFVLIFFFIFGFWVSFRGFVHWYFINIFFLGGDIHENLVVVRVVDFNKIKILWQGRYKSWLAS